MMKNRELISTRLLVAFLGEKEQLGWWNTGFLGSTGQRYLGFNFPRSSLSAGMNAATHAACQLHDERIGRGRVFHLFRLPSSMEEEIHASLLDDKVQESLLELIPDRDAALRSLATIAKERDKAHEGPVTIGGKDDIQKKNSVSKLAAYYLHAFNNGTKVFPYFEGN